MYRRGRRRLGTPRRHQWLRRVLATPIAAAIALSTFTVFQATSAAALPLGRTFVVTTTADALDVNPGDGACRTSTGECSLRAAIQETNALAGADTIGLEDGVYELENPVLNEDAPETGDFDVHDSVTFVGTSVTGTVIDGGVPAPGAPPEQPGMDRLFEIHPSAQTVEFVDLTLREGFSSDDGGAILNWSSGLLRLENVDLLANQAAGSGGAIHNGDAREYAWLTPDPSHEFLPGGRIEIVDSLLSFNAAGGGGAAIFNTSKGNVTISNSKVNDNPGEMIPNPADPTEMIPAPGVYEPDSSAITNKGAYDGTGSIRISDSEVADNWANQNGAGIANEGDGTVVVERSQVTGNTSLAAGGGIFTHGGTVTIKDNSVVADNLAADGGGIASDGASTTIGLRARLTVTNSVVRDNVSLASGGGIDNGGDGHLVITDATVSGNKAGDAGGGLNHEGRSSLELTRVIFSQNETHDEGGGAYVGSERLAIVKDSTFDQNKAGTPEPPEPGAPPSDPSSANIAGGGGMYTENGPVEIVKSTFTTNTSTDEGGALSIDNFGDMKVVESTFKGNKAGTDGGAIENSGARVTFDRLMITENRATLDGGGIYNSSSGEFTIINTTVQQNSAVDGGGLANAPDNKMYIKNSLFLRNTARTPPFGEDGQREDGGQGGGIWSMADGDTHIENTTVSGNVAATGGGGIFHDADGEIKLSNVTVWRNKAPLGGGIGVVESDFVPEVPPKPNVSVILRNSIVGGSVAGGSCDYYVTSAGGNVDSGRTCFISVIDSDSTPPDGRDRRGDPQLDAIADNGGPTLTHMPRYGSIAIDTAANPCPETDQRGVKRPQNGRCDSGAVEFEGPPPIADSEAPDTEYLTGPIQDSLETVAFTFRGTDNLTTADELQFECRLVEIELTEAPEPLAPWDPVPPELAWQQCSSPWSVPLVEEGLFDFEVRAIDRAGNTDQTPDIHHFDGTDQVPPNTIIDQAPTDPSNARTATFTFTAEDNITPPQFMEYECRLDSRDPDLWLECFNPAIFSNLTSGQHTMEVRAYDGNENVDPTPARYTWTVGLGTNGPVNCDTANIALTATSDAWVDQVNPTENYLFSTELTVRSGAVGDPTAVPPEPVVGENARALVKFDVPSDAPDCTLESAKLKLYSDSHTEGRTLTALPLGGQFRESTVTWANQPAALTPTGPTVSSGIGYREFDVTNHVRQMMDGTITNHGWSIRDAAETDPEGGDQSLASRELPQDPPEQTLPVLELTYAAETTPAPPPPTTDPGTAPTDVHCGMVIKKDTIVANDLECLLGEGLVIGAPNIVLDLNGHTIDGPNYLLDNVSGQEEGFPAAVRNSGHSNVIIRNGTVQEMGYGVLLTSGTTRNVVESLTVMRNAMAGIELFDADDGRNGNTVQNNTITDNELGVTLLAGAQNSVVRNNLIGGNLGEQIMVQFSSGHLLENNTVHGIPSDPTLDSDGGILFDGAANNIMRGGQVRDTGDAGVVIHQGSNGNRVQDVEMFRNGDAGVIIQDSDRTEVINITAHQESDGGVVINNGHGTVVKDSDLRYNPSGVEASNSNDLLIQRNDGSDSLQTGFEIGNGVNIEILDNVANNTGGAGISMEGGAFDASGNPVGGALIEGNTANENLENGIAVADGGHTIEDNDAHNNAGFGISIGENPEVSGDPYTHTNHATPLSNRATGNGEVTQCSGLICDETGAVPAAPLDTEPPNAVLLSGPTAVSPAPPSRTANTSASFTFTGTDNASPLSAMVFECRIDPPPDPLPEVEEPPFEPPEPGLPEVPEPVDGLGWTECSSPMHYHGLEQGPHHFEVRVLDQADLRDLTPAVHDWTVDISVEEEGTGPDSSAPDTRIAAGPTGETTNDSASFSFAGSDNSTPGMNLAFECRLDSSDPLAWVPCTSPQSYTGLSHAPHKFEVRAIDRATPPNVDPTPASREWTVVAPPSDTTPPDTTLESGPDHVTTLRTATYTFSSADETATFECRLDGGSWGACSSPHTLTNLATGVDHQFNVRAKDPTGNVDPTPAGKTWFVGATPTPGFVFCGQVITQSIVVKNDLIDCLWDGLRIGANNITIDLDGHMIDGKGVAAAIRNDGFDNVTIKNGKVTDYDYGVMLNPGTTQNIVENMTTENNQEAGISLGVVPHPTDPTLPYPEAAPPSFQSNVVGNILRNNTINSNSIGVWLTNRTAGTEIRNSTMHANSEEGVWVERSSNSRIESNKISGTSGAAVSLQGSNGNTVLENQITENGDGVHVGVTTAGTPGLPSNDNRIEKNTILESGGAGVSIEESYRNTVVSNIATFSNGDGVSLYKAQETLVKDNDLRSNKGGLSLVASSNNRLEGNDASTSEGTGISLEALSVGNVLLNNDSSNNDGDGIYVGDETSGGSGMWIEGNRTHNNKGYGIYVPKVSHTLKANIANDNGGWGIWASEGSNGRTNIDAGGNKAQGNMGPLDAMTQKPLQCFSIRCDGQATTQQDPIAPDTQLLGKPADPSSDAVQVFRFTGTDNASTVEFQCSLDDAPWAPCASPAEYTHTDLINLTGHALGDHTFAVRAVDLAGNVDLSPAAYEWSVGPIVASPAAVTIDSGPDATTVETSATFSFSTSTSGTVECSLDGAAYAACTSPSDYSGLAVGEHTFTVRFTDVNGQEATDQHTWKITVPAVAATVTCGEIIVRSIKLKNDLINCAGNGLIVGTSGITIDLDGHTIDGVGLDTGILNNGFDSVTITNGAVHEFDFGVHLNPGAGLNIVENLQLELNQEAGIALSDADQAGAGNTVRNNNLLGNGVGIAVYSGTKNALIQKNSLGGNTAEGIYVEMASVATIESNEIATSGGAGISLVGGGSHTVRDNELKDNGDGIVVGEELLGTHNTTVANNVIVAGGGGITVNDSSGTAILENRVRDTNGSGVALSLASNSVVRGNDVRANKGGIALDESSSNRIESNNASDTLGTGIEMGALSFDNLVLNNTANTNGGEGIAISDGAPAGRHNTLVGNTADGNGGDGITLDAAGHVVEDNSASVNAGWGIYAAVGAVDRGGNYAAGNVEPQQCYNVVCEIGAVPGAPETWIIDKPPLTSNSRNASFTYSGSDNVNALHELVFECRLDSNDPLAWEDCEYPAEFLNLSAGPHTVEIRAVDLTLLADPTPAKYTWTYAPLPPNDAPESFIDIKPPAETMLPDAIFTFHSNEPDVTFECKVDLFPYEPCGFDTASHMSQGAFEWGLTETEVGPHVFSVRAIDFEGNVGDAATYTWSLLGVVTTFTSGPGFTPGETPQDPPTGGETAESTATIGFVANVADATFECSLDLEPFAPCTSPVTYTDLLAGSHELRVIATGADGATELEAAVYEWEVVDPGDAVAPETLLELVPANNSSSTTFEFIGTDNITFGEQLIFQCRLDSTSDLAWEECTSPFNLLDLYTYADPEMAPGQHTFEVRAVDAADPLVPDPNNPEFEGNVDPTPATHTWTSVADTTPPGTGISVPLPATIGQQTEALVEFFGTDNATPLLHLEFECSLDSAEWAACSSPENVSGLEPGQHELRIRAVDLAGNLDLSPAVETFEVVPAPVTTITSGPAGRVVEGEPFTPPSTSENAIFVFSSDQPGSTFECSLDGVDFRRCTSPQAFWVVDNGEHVFEVRATNPEGVVEEPAASYTWNVELGPDTTRPNTSILSGPPAVDSNSVATFTFAGTDNRTPPAGLTFECALDGTAYSSCTSPDQWSDLVRGTHVLLVRARDAAGNFDSTPARYEWRVETPPVTTILSGPGEITESTTANFTFAADVPGSTYECWMDGLQEPCTSPKSYSDIGPGEHLFAVLATAPGGTTEEQWAEYEWISGEMDPPLTVITSGPGIEHETSEPVEFAFSTTATGTSFECAIDGGQPTPCTSPKRWSRLALGEHTFTVQAVHPPMFDRFGEPIDLLYEPVASTYTFTIVDTTPPDTSVTYGPNATTASPNAYFGVSSSEPGATVQCSLDFTGFGDCATPYVIEDLLPGQHTLQVRAIDAGGLVDPTPVDYTWTVTSAATNTPVGNNVKVNLPMPDGGTATATFFEVSLAGATTLDGLTGGPSMTAGYGGARYFDLHTTAEYGEPARICLPYDPADYEGSAARLLQYDEPNWVDVTVTNNPFTGVVCAEPGDFGLLALARGNGVFPLASIVEGPENPASSGDATFTFFADQPGAITQCSLDGLPYEHCTSPKTYTKLEAGSHTFSVQAIGINGTPNPAIVPPLYEWEVVLPPDVTAPDTRITAGPGALTGNYINTFEFTGTDDQTADIDLEFECLLDGVLLGSCSSPDEVEVLAAGRHTFTVRAIDEFGNVDATPATRVFTVVDVNAPDTSIELGPESETEASTAIFEFIGEEPDGTLVNDFECSLDGADFTACTSPHTIENLSVGSHVFEVRAKDNAGVVDSTPEFYEWLRISGVDTTPPDTFIASAPPAVTGPDVIFGFQSDEVVESYECKVDNGPWEGCEPATELVGLTSGQHTLLVRAIDLAESPNVDPTPASHTWNVVGEPETTITGSPDEVSAAQSATFTFTSDQPNATFKCSVDGSAFTACTSPFVAGPLIQDTHSFEVQAANEFRYLDGEQVVDLTPATFEWTVQDTAPPETVLTSVTHLGPADLVEPDSIRFEITGSDNGTVWFELGFECQLDNGPWEGCDAPFHYLPLLELSGGTHTMRIRAIDAFENVDPAPVVHEFTTEAGPETTVLSGPVPESDATQATFEFGTDGPAGTTYQCSLDGALFAACSNPVTFTGVAHGEHELLVRAKGPAGAVDLTPAEYSWATGDTTPPVVTITDGPQIATTDTSATFAFMVDDPDAALQCSLDGAVPTSCTSGLTLTDLATGPHTFEVTAIKAHLLVETVPAVWEWTVEDQTAPQTTLASTPAAELGLGTEAVFTFSSNEAEATFDCSLDGASFAECAGPPDNTATFSGLDAGEHTVRVRAVDTSLNVDASPELFTFMVVGPAITSILTGPEAESTTTDRTAAFTFSADQPGVTFTCSLDGADPIACSSGVSYAALTFGGHTFEVQSINRFGLVEEPGVSRAWTVAPPDGIIAPESTITAGPEPRVSATSATFEFAADQAGTFECALDNGAWEACDSPKTYTDLDEGAHTLAVQVTNTFGVTEEEPATYGWTVDLEPQTFVDSGPDAITLSTTAVFNFSSNEPLATFECSLDQTPASFASCEHSATFENLTVGSHEMLVRAVDDFGNVDPTPASHRWTIGAPPDTTIATYPESPTESRTATFTFTSTVADATFECALDEAAEDLFFQPCTSPATYNDLTFGDHVLLVRAVDGAGNLDPTPAEQEWEIGGVPPVVTITEAPPVTTESRVATFEFSAPGSGLNYECALDSSNWSPCVSPKVYNGVPYGEHSFSVRVFSPNPVFEPPVSTHTWSVVKVTVPETTLLHRPPAVTGPGSSDAPIAFTFSSNEPTATFECALDSEAFSGCETPAAYEDLVPGSHTFRVRAVDVAGNRDTTPASHTWTVAPAPDTAVVTGPDQDLGSGTDASFTFSSDLTGSTFECRLNEGAWSPCSNPYELTGLADGEYLLEVRAVSQQGIVDETPAEWTWTAGLVPDTSVVTGPAASTTSTSAAFTFSASEPDVTFECALDGSPFLECEAPSDFVHHLVEGLSLGSHTLRVRAVDADGNIDETPASHTWTVIAAPQTTIDSGPAQDEPNPTSSFEFSSNDPAATFECSLDLGTWATCTSPQQYTDLALGFHSFSVRALNGAGNPDPSPASYSWNVVEPAETNPPDTTIDQAPASPTASTTAVFRFSASELGSTFECSLDAAAYAPCEPRTEYTNLATGEHTLLVRATDAAGNVDPTPASYTWTVTGGDATAPIATIDSGPEASSSSTSAAFTFSSNEPGSTFQCSLDGGSFDPCTSPKTYTNLAVGEFGDHTLHVRAIDTAGNVGNPTLPWEWTALDTVVPNTVITDGPADPSTTGSATFEFSGTDNGTPVIDLEFECNLDGAGFQPCSSTVTYAGLSSGSHTFEVRAVDAEGNVDDTPASRTWNVVVPDTTAPVVTLTGPETGTTEAAAAFAFSADEPGTTFTCSLDGEPVDPCTSPVEVSGLAVGEHSFSVTGTDADGNASTATHAWEIAAPTDTTAPVVTVVSGPPAMTPSRSATIEFEADEPATFKCRLDGQPAGSYNSCTSPVVLNDLAVGSHVFEIQATDTAGNVSAPVSVSWQVMDPPNTTILTSPQDPTDQTTATFTFEASQDGSTFKCSLDGALFSTCTSGLSHTGLADGDHEFEVVATGPAGNTDPTPATFSWSIGDITPPVISIVSGPTSADGGSTEATTAEFTFSVDDPDAVLRCSLDGTTPRVCTSPKTYSALELAAASGSAIGEHTLEITAEKHGLLVPAEPVRWTWTVDDATAPETTIDATPPARIGLGTAATFTFSSNEADATFDCALDGSALESCTSPHELDLTAGSHTLEVRAVDSSDNVDPTPASYTWTVVGAPTSTVSRTVDGTSATFTFSADQPGVTYECSLDTDPFAPCTSPLTRTGLTPGSHTLSVRATNEFDLVESPAATADVTVEAPATNTPTGTNVAVDTGPATVTFAQVTAAGNTTATALDSPPALPAGYLEAGATYYDLTTDATYSGLVTVCFEYGADAAQPVRLLHHDGTEWVDVTTSNDNTARVVCGETDGLSPFAVVSAEVFPTTRIVDHPPATTASPSASFSFASDDPAATFECSLDLPDAWNSCDAVTTLTGLGFGEHTLLVRAKNADGNVDASPASHTWTVDPPETRVVSGPPATGVNPVADFEFSSTDPAAEFECALDGDLWGSCETPYQLDVPVGAHTIQVRAKNDAGNVDPSPASYSWTVRALPETTITASPVDPTDQRSATFEFTSDLPGASFQCALDEALASSQFTPCTSPKTYTNLTMESHDFAVRALDAEGNADPTPAEFSWEIGEIPPSVTIESGPSGSTEDRSATFTFSAPGTPGTWTYECSLNGSTYSACTSPKTYTGLPMGAQTFEVRVHSPEAVVEVDPAVRTWTVADLTAPETTIDFGPQSPTNNTTAEFGFSSNEQNATFECALDDAAFAACPDPTSYVAVPAGAHTLQVRAVDTSGSPDGTPASYSWTVVDDSTAPETTINDKPPARTEATVATFSFSADEPGSTFECRLDTEPFGECELTAEYTDLALGDHTFEVRAIDLLGNVDGTPESYTWTVVLDATDPETTIASAPPASTQDTTASIRFTSNETGATFECSVDGGAYEECTSPELLTDLTPGEHTFAVRAVDAALNVDPTPAGVSWTVEADSAAPQTTIASGPEGTATATVATFTFNSSEPGSTFECALDNEAFAACESPLQLSELTAGQHTMLIRATDPAGNIEETPASRTWTVLVAPETTVESGPESSTESTHATFTFSADQTGATFECRVGGASFTPCTSPKTYTGLSVADHTFEVRAISAQGAADESPALHEWTIEPATMPDTTIGSGPEAATTSHAATFTFISDETGTTFECKLDGAAYANCTSPSELTGLALGEHTFSVRATDADGNVDATPATRVWTVVPEADTVAPDTTITDGPAESTSDRSASVVFSGTDDRTATGDLTFECRLDDTPDWTACSSPKAYADLAPGSHTVRVRTVDAAGNVDESPATRTWTVLEPADTVAPQTTIGTGPPDPTTDRSASVTFSGSDDSTAAGDLTFECRLDGGGWVGCASPASYTNLANGLHTLEVRAVDGAGNADASPAFHQWWVTEPRSTDCGPTQTVGASGDAWIDQNSPSTNKGTDSVLKVQSKSGSNNFRALVRFALPAVPANCVVQSATLRLWNDGPKSGRTIQALRVAADWTESQVTWANQPATTGPAATVPSGSTKSYRDWAVTAQVQAMLGSAGNYGFLIRDASENQGSNEQQFFGREKGMNMPQLVVVFVPAPPDTTPPETSIGSGPAITTTETTATFSFSATEAGAAFECSLDGALFGPCNPGTPYPELGIGPHDFLVRARDLAGNVDATPAHHAWTIN